MEGKSKGVGFRREVVRHSYMAGSQSIGVPLARECYEWMHRFC